MAFVEVLTVIGIIAGRNVLGWAINSLKDGKIQDYEWVALFKSMFVILGISTGLLIGLPDSSFVDIAALTSGGDMILSELKAAIKK